MSKTIINFSFEFYQKKKIVYDTRNFASAQSMRCTMHNYSSGDVYG